MTKKNSFKTITVLLVICLFGFSGCGDSKNHSREANELTVAEAEEAFSTVLIAHIEKQTAIYRLIRILSNDYQNGFMELELTAAQLQEAMDEILRMESIAKDALAAQEKLTTDPTAMEKLQMAGVLSTGKKATKDQVKKAFLNVNCTDFCNEAVGTAKELRNTLNVNAKKMTDDEKEALWQSMPDSIRRKASSSGEFYNMLQTGELDDDMGAINASLSVNADYYTSPATEGMRPWDFVLNKAKKLLAAGVKKYCSSFIDLGGGAPKVFTEAGKKALDVMADEFNDFKSKEGTVTYKDVATDSPFASLPEAERLGQAVFNRLDGTKEVDDEDVDSAGTPVVKDVDAHDAAWFASQSMEIIGKVWGAFSADVLSFVGVTEEQGMVVVSAPEDVDASDVEGFVTLEPTAPISGCPNLIMGFGAPTTATDPIWAGMLPEGEWQVTLQSLQGTLSDTQTVGVTAGATVMVSVTPPEPLEDDVEAGDDATAHGEESNWFDWVENVDEDGNGIPFVDNDGNDGDDGNGSSGGGTTVSCSQRTNNGSCVDYVGVNDASISDLSTGCTGVFSTSACASSDATFTCGLTISSSVDTYDVRIHYYFMASVPQSTINQTCESMCNTYNAIGNVTISNCSAL
ncbi:MAG: hypothetical protein JXR76_16260 [Deltaproteobacteria bacterium]|nr:hypothetical protein [Deltaproteobacteria bacterium]